MSDPSRPAEVEDRYYTQVDAGDVRLFTLDQLDAAFNVGLIDEQTYVCVEGHSNWLTLAEVAGLVDHKPPVAPATHAIAPSSPLSVAPMVTAIDAGSSEGSDLDERLNALLSRRAWRRKVLVGVAAFALGGVGVVLVHGARSSLATVRLGDEEGQNSAASLRLPDAKRPTADERGPEPPKTTGTTDHAREQARVVADTEEGADERRLSEETTKARRTRDKKVPSATKAKQSGKRRPPLKINKAASTFNSGGSAYDPLNGKL